LIIIDRIADNYQQPTSIQQKIEQIAIKNGNKYDEIKNEHTLKALRIVSCFL
jgi:hypothetical protein